jgi:DNA (cytosine-5)-methyltransferase 1
VKYGSLFSGIGGFDLGFDRAGMECAWQVEIDDHCRQVLEKHWSGVPKYKDVRDVGKHNLEPVDVICGGFPCQDVSLAGTRAGLEGKRSTLWTEFARIIRELEPRWVVAENVPGLFSSDNGRFFGNILRDLASCGYDAEWQVLPAAAFGAPHIRERVFLLAYPNSQQADIKLRQPREFSRQSRRTLEARKETTRQENGEAGNYYASRLYEVSRGWWSSEPCVGRVVDGLPGRVDRLRQLGNAVVPQVAEWIGRRVVGGGA